MMLHMQQRWDKYSVEEWQALRTLIEFRSGRDNLVGALEYLGRKSALEVKVLESDETARVVGLSHDFDEFAGPLVDRLGGRDGIVGYHCAWIKLVEGRRPGATAAYIEKEFRKRQRLETDVTYISTALATDFETIDTLVARSIEMYAPSRIEVRCAVASREVMEMKIKGVTMNVHAYFVLPEYGSGHTQNTFGSMLCRLPDVRQRSTFMPTYVSESALPGLRFGR
ncbi:MULTISPECIES: hypothetical protein [unclassified Rhizobium]|uniref:hypothetical protein n=1 Tax=unclassified Rhizobium TaxID=2613769 RepID=UPI001784E108|nr:MULTISPECIES: hypothetical protein [unclassified Rhizobium]MBD8687189.1 hypothetical protein [Rhizobium sp. CFBP 13644]MBD8691008.1 hypothetical protein [Rhizobium sp. CFBP 13717]